MCQKAVHEELENMNQASAGWPRSLWQSRATVQVPAAGGFFLCLAALLLLLQQPLDVRSRV